MDSDSQLVQYHTPSGLLAIPGDTVTRKPGVYDKTIANERYLKIPEQISYSLQILRVHPGKGLEYMASPNLNKDEIQRVRFYMSDPKKAYIYSISKNNTYLNDILDSDKLYILETDRKDDEEDSHVRTGHKVMIKAPKK